MNIKKVVKLELRKCDDGYWLNFINKEGRIASINIDIYFPRKILVHHTIRQWAKQQFIEK